MPRQNNWARLIPQSKAWSAGLALMAVALGQMIAWGIETRNGNTASGLQPVAVFSSITLGEQYTGKFSTAPFAAPDQLSFYLCGHNGKS